MSLPLWMKFGGAALADGPAVRRVCRIVARRAGERPALVVSAHLGVTDLLEGAARAAAAGEVAVDRARIRHRALLRQLALDPELLDRHLKELAGLLESIRSKGRSSPAERDHVLSFGERMSARVVAAALREAGLLATPVDAFDLGLTTSGAPGRARPLPGFEARIRAALEAVPGIPVVTGFLAQDVEGQLTTLGRNGSDLTAAVLAEATGARELVFWKGVPGVMTADPELVPRARVIPRLGFGAARELALHGSKVLHPEALAPAARCGARVRVLDVEHPEEPGTLLVDRPTGPGGGADEEVRPVAIACERELVALSLTPAAEGGMGSALTELFELLHRHGVEPRFVCGGPAGLGIYTPPAAAFSELAAELSKRVRLEAPAAAVTVVGTGGAALGRRALECLEAEGLVVARASFDDGGMGQALFVPPPECTRAARALHAGLLEESPARQAAP